MSRITPPAMLIEARADLLPVPRLLPRQRPEDHRYRPLWPWILGLMLGLCSRLPTAFTNCGRNLFSTRGLRLVGVGGETAPLPHIPIFSARGEVFHAPLWACDASLSHSLGITSSLLLHFLHNLSDDLKISTEETKSCTSPIPHLVSIPGMV